MSLQRRETSRCHHKYYLLINVLPHSSTTAMSSTTATSTTTSAYGCGEHHRQAPTRTGRIRRRHDDAIMKAR